MGNLASLKSKGFHQNNNHPAYLQCHFVMKSKPQCCSRQQSTFNLTRVNHKTVMSQCKRLGRNKESIPCRMPEELQWLLDDCVRDIDLNFQPHGHILFLFYFS